MDRALDVDGRSLSFAAPPLRGDRALVLKSIRQGYLDILEVASSQVRDDRSLMLEAVQLSGFALQYASARLQGDKAFVLQAVQTDGHALGYAQRQLWADRDLLLASYRQKAEFFGRSHAWSEQDSNRLQQSVRIPGFSSDIPAALEADREVVLAYHTLNASLPVCVVEDVCLAQTLRGDQDLIAQLLRLDVRLPLWTLSGAVRSNRALALQAVEVAGSNLQYAAATLRNDPSFVLEALRLNVSCLPYTPRWLRHHKPFMLKACLERELALRWASAPWDDAFNKLCLRQTWSKTRAMGRSVANSGFALRALLGLSGAHKV
jgi:hypothetical protein